MRSMGRALRTCGGRHIGIDDNHAPIGIDLQTAQTGEHQSSPSPRRSDIDTPQFADEKALRRQLVLPTRRRIRCRDDGRFISPPESVNRFAAKHAHTGDTGVVTRFDLPGDGKDEVSPCAHPIPQPDGYQVRCPCPGRFIARCVPEPPESPVPGDAPSVRSRTSPRSRNSGAT